MKKIQLTFLFILALGLSLQSQNRRYFDPIFSDVQVTSSVEYGVNSTILFLPVIMEAVPQVLECDIYEPMGDTETDRPLVIVMHSGNFLPPTVNGGCVGTIDDADNIRLATELAKRGYVVAVADYRLGWNPIASEQEERVFTLINAAYRGVQDARTCIRFFRKDHMDTNQYGIDPDKITLWGFGTGGYISAAAATLDTITDTYIPKFLTMNGPMVIEPAVGNLDGTSVGIAFQGYPHPVVGDTLCYPNHVGYSSEFALAVNLGGALGDTSWIDADDVPIISFHAFDDPFAPCYTDIVNVPEPPLPVVEASGSCAFQPIFNSLGLADVFINAGFTDAVTSYAAAHNGGIEGFYPIYGDDSSPWAFSSSAEPYGVMGSDCELTNASNEAFMDTILHYFLPRSCAMFQLDGDCQLSTSVDQLTIIEVGLSARPNPTSDVVTLQTNSDFIMQRVELVDLTGRTVATLNGTGTSALEINTSNLRSGVYFARIWFEEGFVTQRIAVQH